MDRRPPRGERRIEHAPVVWRSTLRGVLVLDDELRLLSGLGGAIWLVLADRPRTDAELVAELAEWDVEIDAGSVRDAVDQLIEMGLCRT